MDTKSSPLSALNDASLLKTDALIGGDWVTGEARFEVLDPATGQHLAAVANLGAAETEAAIAAAHKAWPAWRAKAAKERAAVLMKWFALLHQHADDLARIMGSLYGPEYVNYLRAGVGRHLKRPFRFVCFTDDASRCSSHWRCWRCRRSVSQGVSARGAPAPSHQRMQR